MWTVLAECQHNHQQLRIRLTRNKWHWQGLGVKMHVLGVKLHVAILLANTHNLPQVYVQDATGWWATEGVKPIQQRHTQWTVWAIITNNNCVVVYLMLLVAYCC